MATFRYDILFRTTKNKKVYWVLASNPKKGGPNVLRVLNAFGAKGWEVVGTGDFGADSRSEIILKHQTS